MARDLLPEVGPTGLSYSLLSAAVLPALPRLQHDLHTTATGAAWVLTAFLLAAAVATAILGRLGDMYGKEKLLLLTLVILADSTLLAAVSILFSKTPHPELVTHSAGSVPGSGGGLACGDHAERGAWVPTV